MKTQAFTTTLNGEKLLFTVFNDGDSDQWYIVQAGTTVKTAANPNPDAFFSMLQYAFELDGGIPVGQLTPVDRENLESAIVGIMGGE